MQDEKDFEEASILKRLQQGDEHAFLEIYDHYKKPLYSFILKFVKVPAHEDDLLQDVFLKVWQKSMLLVKEIYSATKNFPQEERFGLTSQIQRSAVSIPSNISEAVIKKAKGNA